MPCHATNPSSSHRNTAPTPKPPRASNQPAFAARKVLAGERQQTNILAAPAAFCACRLSKNHSVLLERQLRCTALGTQNYIFEVAVRTRHQLVLALPESFLGLGQSQGASITVWGVQKKRLPLPKKRNKADSTKSASRTALPNLPCFFPSLYPHGWRHSGAAGGLENEAGGCKESKGSAATGTLLSLPHHRGAAQHHGDAAPRNSTGTTFRSRHPRLLPGAIVPDLPSARPSHRRNCKPVSSLCLSLQRKQPRVFKHSTPPGQRGLRHRAAHIKRSSARKMETLPRWGTVLPTPGWLAWFLGQELAKLPVCRLHFQEQKWEHCRTPQSIHVGQTGMSPGRAGLGGVGSTLRPSPRTDTVAGQPRGPRVVQPYEKSHCLQKSRLGFLPGKPQARIPCLGWQSGTFRRRRPHVWGAALKIPAPPAPSPPSLPRARFQLRPLGSACCGEAVAMQAAIPAAFPADLQGEVGTRWKEGALRLLLHF